MTAAAPRPAPLRAARVLPAALLLVAGGLVYTHGALWSQAVGLVLGVFGLLAAIGAFGARRVGGGRTGRGLLLFLAAAALWVGVWLAGAFGWLALVGHATTGTVTAVVVHDQANRAQSVEVDDTTFHTSDGATLTIPLQDQRLPVGDTVALRRDPTHLVAPRLGTRDDATTAVVGLVVAAAGLVVLTLLAGQAPRAPAR